MKIAPEKKIVLNISLTDTDQNKMFSTVDMLEDIAIEMSKAKIDTMYETSDGMSITFDKITEAVNTIQRILWHPETEWVATEQCKNSVKFGKQLIS